MQVTTAEIRALMSSEGGGLPFTSIYLNTDGARYPRASDYEARLDGLLREVRKHAESCDERDALALQADIETISRFVKRDFQRGDTRGLAVFANNGRIVETVESALGLRNVARIGAAPYVVPLEALLGRSHHIALAIVSRDRARVFRYRLGRLEECEQVESEVHGQHDQGGWSQARYQRNIEHDVLGHMKDVAEVLRRMHDEAALDVLVLAGPDPDVARFEPILHPYLREVLHNHPLALSLQASPDDIKGALAAVEQELVSERRRELLDRLAAAQGQAHRAARGIRHVLEAVNAKRVQTLFVVEGAGEPGYKSATGALTLHEAEAAAYGGPVESVPDLIDEVIEEGVRSGAHIELFRDASRLDGDPVSALLRF